MFKFLKNLRKKLDDGDQWHYTEKEADNNEILLDDGQGWVVVSTDRKKLYRGNNSGIDYDTSESFQVHQIYEYILSGNTVFIKEIQFSIEYFYPNNPENTKFEKEFRIKNGEVCVDGIYKRYNNPKNFLKEGTLEQEIEKWKGRCLINPLLHMELTMFILSKSLDKDGLNKAVQEKLKLMNEGKEIYNTMLSALGLTYMDDYFEMEEQIKKKKKVNQYKEGIDAITKKCGCSEWEMVFDYNKTIEKIKSYSK